MNLMQELQIGHHFNHLMQMAQTKSRKHKKYKPQTRSIGILLLYRLTVPESTIKTLKAKHDAILLRIYMGSETFQDRCELYSVLRLGQVLSKFADNADAISARIDEAIALLDHLPEQTKPCERNLDVIKDALELCEDVWRVVSVEEFVREAQALKKTEVAL